MNRRLMRYVEEPSRKIPVISDVDVVVVGGGVAGLAAGIAAARLGANTLLIERQFFLGGMATAGLVITVPPMKQGLQKEIAKKLEEIGAYVPLKGPVGRSPEDLSHVFDPEELKMVAAKMLTEAGVDLLFNTFAVNTILEDDVIRGVIIENKEGRQAILAKVIVDATGDADIAHYANAPCAEETVFPVTLMFNIIGVDVKRVLSTLGDFGKLRNIVQDAIDQGETHFSLQTRPILGAPGIFAQTTVHDDELNVWGGNLFGINGIKAKDLTRSEIILREQAKILADFLKRTVLGFENSRIGYIAPQVGIRETRRIEGEYTITVDDVRTSKEFEDTIARPFAASNTVIPYRCILPRNIKNLLVVGRCISASPEILVYLRLIPACIATGQAGGVAAALSCKEGNYPKKIDIKKLQSIVRNQGLI